MANLSNINNKFIVTDGGQALINQTAPGFNVDADDLIVGNLSGNTGITIASGPNAGNYGSLYFADAAGQGTASKAGYIRYEQNTSKMTIGINAVEKIAIALNGDTTFTGNVGIGITPNTSFSGVDVLQLGKGMTIFGNTDNDRASMCANLYLNASTEFVRVMDGFSGRFAIEDGTMLWGLSATGDADTVVTVNTKMTLLNNGNLGIGTDSPGALLQVGETPTSSSQQGARIYGYDGALSCFTTRAESNFNTALYLFNNPVGEPGTGTGIMLRARSSTTDGQQQATVYSTWTTNTHATRTAKLVFQTANSGAMSDKMTILGNGNVGIGIDAPVAKLHVENRSATSPFAINAQMLIGYNGGSQNFFDADLQYFRNAAFQNILQLSGDGIVGTPNNTQRLRITTDYTQIGPVPVRYPYYRTDSFKSDGSGYFYAFGHENNNGNQSISMMFNDGASGNKYTRIINNLQLSSFASNEVNGQYPTFTTNVVLKNSGTSYFKGGDVAIGATSAGARLDVVMPNSGGVDRQDILRLLQSGQNTLSCYMYGGATDLVQLHVSGTEQNLSLTVGGVATATTSKGIHIRHLTGYVGIDDISPSYQLDVAGDIRATGDVIAYSDVRVKENIKTIDNSLEKVSKLRGVEFNKIGDNIKSIGVIAQEVEKVIPEVVREDDKGMKSVAYGNITGILIEAIKELKAEIEELKSNKCNCNK